MRSRLYVVFVNAAGQEESGIDAGGLFKEFWTQLSAVAFDPQYGLFAVSEDELLYPNPSSEAVHGAEHLRLLEFLGAIVGKVGVIATLRATRKQCKYKRAHKTKKIIGDGH